MNIKITLAEIEFYMRKVARAVELDWGIAEEAGKAARWLAAFNLPGPELLLSHLQNIEGKNYRGFIPDCSLPIWQAPSGLICPIIGGAALADRSAQMLEDKVFELGPVACPLLLAATVGQAARCHQRSFTTSWADASVICHKDGLSIEGNYADLLLMGTESVSCRQKEDSLPQLLPSTIAYSIEDNIWQQIDAMAFKTYAPATEESRAGAGAGLTDND